MAVVMIIAIAPLAAGGAACSHVCASLTVGIDVVDCCSCVVLLLLFSVVACPVLLAPLPPLLPSSLHGHSSVLVVLASVADTAAVVILCWCFCCCAVRWQR
jgi:hypothetical protein